MVLGQSYYHIDAYRSPGGVDSALQHWAAAPTGARWRDPEEQSASPQAAETKPEINKGTHLFGRRYVESLGTGRVRPATYRTTAQHTAEKESRPQTGFLPERQVCRSRRGKTRSLHPSRHPAGQQPDLLEAGGATPGALRQPGIPAEARSATHPGRTRTAHLPATQRLQQRLVELAVQQRRQYQANQDLAGQPPVREQCRAPGGRSLARLGDHSCADLAGPRRSGQR